MLAVALFVDEKGSLPSVLSKFLEWRYWGKLPRAGGTQDQRAGELTRMKLVGSTYDAWKLYKTRPPGWNRAPDWMWRLIWKLTDDYGYE